MAIYSEKSFIKASFTKYYFVKQACHNLISFKSKNVGKISQFDSKIIFQKHSVWETFLNLRKGGRIFQKFPSTFFCLPPPSYMRVWKKKKNI